MGWGSLSPKQEKALKPLLQGHARMQVLIEDMRAGKSLCTDPEILRLAQEGVDADLRKQAELAVMTPEQREEDVRTWANNLAGDVGDLND